ncbi:MAG: methylaspartate ammonia-lyase, partial [Firmicutes bacterium]|nr:methylaspartate ammonia-lyase [Bacillota bacterium]
MHIVDVVTSPGFTGFYTDDQRAVKSGVKRDGLVYSGSPVTPGFTSIRQPGQSLSVQLVLSNGQVAYGDCATVQYAGVGGREGPLDAEKVAGVIQREVVPWLKGSALDSFRDLCRELQGLPLAVQYGVSQAILDAMARSRGQAMCQVIAQEWSLSPKWKMIPILTQSGDDRYLQADKMILKQVPVMPHGLFNSLDKVGPDGEGLLEYVSWLAARVKKIGAAGYAPVFQLDVYGLLGSLFDGDEGKLVDYLGDLAKAASPYGLRIESPVDVGGRDEQIQALAGLRRRLQEKDVPVGIVADEWCNTLEDIEDFAAAGAVDMIQIKTPDLGSLDKSIEAVLTCHRHGVEAYLGGTCNETDRSAQICSHIALATQPAQVMAKPGMGVDEGLCI